MPPHFSSVLRSASSVENFISCILLQMLSFDSWRVALPALNTCRTGGSLCCKAKETLLDLIAVQMRLQA